MGLYSSTKRMTTTFYTSIICVTLVILVLRLTVFSNMATTAPADKKETPSGALEGSEISGNSDFPYQMNGKIYFENSDGYGNVLIQNPDTNNYLLNINIIQPESKDSLYYTGSIPPGSSIENARLSANGKRLENGKYECVAEISAIDPEDYRSVQSQEVPVTIYIGEKP